MRLHCRCFKSRSLRIHGFRDAEAVLEQVWVLDNVGVVIE